MTSHRRDINLGISPITIPWYAPLALLLCLGLAYPAELRAQDTTQAPAADTVSEEAQDTLESADSTVVVDPAVAAGPFVTTSNDITGLLIYFSLAAWLLSLGK